jgi:hypothetical protein
MMLQREFDFDQMLAVSKGVVAETCEQTIIGMLPGCILVAKTEKDVDRTGIDYIATLRGGSLVFIDHKLRLPGCSNWWMRAADGTRIPELALELWSVVPENGRPGKTGWTLDESKATHYTLHTFDPSDSRDAYLMPFQLLRKAYRSNFSEWNKFQHGEQTSRRGSSMWRSECVFVPVNIVIEGIRHAMHGSVWSGPVVH